MAFGIKKAFPYSLPWRFVGKIIKDIRQDGRLLQVLL
jgi:hypothetical protein